MMDNDVLDRVSLALPAVRMETPVETIFARARTRRRRRLQVGAVSAAGVALTLAVLAVTGSGDVRPPVQTSSPRLVAFTVADGPNGSAVLTLRKGAQYRLDPGALHQALAEHGIPSVVNVGRMCDTSPEPTGLDQVISSQRLADGSVVTTFDPAAMPPGSEISIGYFPSFTTFALVEDGAPTNCSTNPQAPVGSSARVKPTP